MPISPFMDRNIPTLPKMQIGFIDFIVTPLCEKIVPLFPKLSILLERLIENKERWKRIQEEG